MEDMEMMKHVFEFNLNSKKAQELRDKQMEQILNAPTKVYLYKDGEYIEIWK